MLNPYCNVLPLNQLIAFNCLRLIYDYANKILPPSFGFVTRKLKAIICVMAMISK